MIARLLEAIRRFTHPDLDAMFDHIESLVVPDDEM